MDEPESKEYKIERYFEDSPVGSGDATAQLFVVPKDPVVTLILTWEPEDTMDQPDRWEITWCHHPHNIWDAQQLERFLTKYCPAPEQVFQVARAMHGRMMAQKDLYG
jgi:hypothetical protein